MHDDQPRVRLLGPVQIAGRDGRLVDPPGTRIRALVAALGLEPGRPHSVEALTDQLWADEPPRAPRAAVQTLVSRLRTALPDGLIAFGAAGYSLTLDAAQTDLGQARLALVEAGKQTDPATAVAALDRALGLWRGEPGADLGDAPVQEQLRARAEALRLDLIAERARRGAEAGDIVRAAADLAELVEARPFDESVLASYLENLAAQGRIPEALAAFAAHRERLADDLGSSPGAALVELNTRLLRTAEPDPQPRRRVGVRAAPNELIGRDDDLDRVEALLRTARLVTVLGAGGLGKTRLAQALATRSARPVVIVVELAGVRSDEDVTLALASTLGIRESTTGQRLGDVLPRPDVRGRIVGQLAERPTLLVMDNCEHLVDGAAAWIAELLAAAPELRVLATSRSPLAIGAEVVYPLQPLAASADGPAVRLFLERARAVRPAANLPVAAVQRLCAHLDGLPLAIELAAARVRSMTVEQIESRLQNRFALLAGGDRSAPERHRTLQAVIEWSWRLLSVDEQNALRLLSVFPDGFSAEAAAAVTGGDWADDLLDGLIGQSLLTVAEEPLTAALRYRMLETVREFGQAELAAAGQQDAALEALFGWAHDFAAVNLTRLPDLAVVRAITVEQDNLVTVLRQAIAGHRPALVVTLFALLSYYWTIRGGHSEVYAFAGDVLDAVRHYEPDEPHVDATVLSYALLTATALAEQDGVWSRAYARLRRLVHRHTVTAPDLAAIAEFLVTAPDRERAAEVVTRMRASDDVSTALLGELFTSQEAENAGRPDEASAAARRAWQLASRAGDLWRGPMAAMLLAGLATQRADPAEALYWADQAEGGLRELQADDDLRQLDWSRAGALIGLGRADEARVLLERLLSSGPPDATRAEYAAMAECGLAELARLEGDPRRGIEHYRRALEYYRDPAQRGSPWHGMVLAALLSAGIADGSLDASERAECARRLRFRALVMNRVRLAGIVDRPILGAQALGLSAWLLTCPEFRGRGLELLALAEVLHSRQDLPSLRWAPHRAAAEAIVGPDAVAEARRAASELSLEDAADRAHELIAQRL
ncbi:MAG: BTAD domain-containing putative transcriptional regulator [Micropruina sp.]|uniref:BTAD domain-containing putative transcriptional regulator n=1 Tax=Micropruina sp. TaxID=2737536 RepID=UPI0039E5677D